MVSDKENKILNLLMENSRQSFRDISKKAKTSVVTVIKKVKEFEKRGIIKSYSANLDYEKLGYDVQAIINLKIARGKLFEVENKLAHLENVSNVYDTTGDFDCLVIVKFKTRRDLDKFLKKIQKYDFIERTMTKLILNIIKEESIKVK